MAVSGAPPVGMPWEATVGSSPNGAAGSVTARVPPVVCAGSTSLTQPAWMASLAGAVESVSLSLPPLDLSSWDAHAPTSSVAASASATQRAGLAFSACIRSSVWCGWSSDRSRRVAVGRDAAARRPRRALAVLRACPIPP
jgi:hypothetical protein